MCFNIYYPGGCPRIGNLLRKSQITPYFRSFSLDMSNYPPQMSENLGQTGFPSTTAPALFYYRPSMDISLRLLFSGSLLATIKRAILSILLSVSIVSCDSGSTESAGISGTGIVFGKITGFGSIFVNGVEYEIGGADFNVDGKTMVDQNALGLGMVVKLIATDNGDGAGIATSVFYDEVVEGPVAEDPFHPNDDTSLKQFTVLGQSVIINTSSTSFKDVTFAEITGDDVLEVSGFIDQDKKIIATRIERKGELEAGITEVEIHGQISRVIDSNSFEVNGLTVTYGLSTELEDIGTVSEDLFVEVQGIFQSATSVTADKIEGEDDDREEIENSEGKVSLQGIITAISSTTEFSVNGISVDVDTTQVSASILTQLVLGLQVEVEGNMQSGVLTADEVEIRKDERKYKAIVASIDIANQTIRIRYPNVTGEIELVVDSQSELEDELSSGPLTLSNLVEGDEVNIEASISGGAKRVKSLKRKLLEKYQISGVVDEIIGDVSITIDGLIFQLDANVNYKPLDLLTQIQTGITVLEMEDKDKDSDIDEVEIE